MTEVIVPKDAEQYRLYDQHIESVYTDVNGF